MLGAVLLAGCGETKEAGDPGFIQGFVGGAAADEPRAAIVGRDILGRGGTAADAATAMFFTLTVTKPSAASLGAVGGCVYFDSASGSFSAFDFAPRGRAAPANGPPPVSPPAAVRGMAALHARHGALAWAELVGPAEALARFGHAVSRSLATDLAERAAEIGRDPGFRRVFGRPDGSFAREGDRVEQLELAATLSQIRQYGAGALFSGPLANAYADAVRRIGGALSVEELRAYTPRAPDPILRPAGPHKIAFLPTLNSNGPQQARLWRLLAENGELEDAARDERLHVIAEASVAAHASFARAAAQPGADLDNLDEAALERLDQAFRAFDPNRARPVAAWLDGVAPIPSEASGTSLVAVDRTGGAAACGFTLYRPFGAARLLPGIGAAPALRPPPGVVSSAIGPIVVGNVNTGNFFLAVGGAGGGAASVEVAIAARTLLGDEEINGAVGAPRFARGGGPAAVDVEADMGQEARENLRARGYTLNESPPIARVNAAFCQKGLPRDENFCNIRTDWRGHGLASSAQ